MLQGGAMDWPAMSWGIAGLLSRCGSRKLDKCRLDEHRVHPGFTGWVRRPDSLEPVSLPQYATDHKVQLETLEDLVRLQQRGLPCRHETLFERHPGGKFE
jgi:hypothetical protein